VGRPIFFSVAIMLLSFLPVFALDGLAGKMFRPLAATKSLAMLAAAVLAITLVPALCAVLVRGRVRGENASWLVRSVAGVYRPVLDSLLDRPGLVAWMMGATLLCGLAPLGIDWLWRLTLLAVLVGTALVIRGWRNQVLSLGSLVLVGLVAQQVFQPLPRAFLAPLDEQTVMDMPITVPRTTIMDAADDLKARDMVLCRFPEVEMVMGKAGRAQTATDPAPIDMIETMIGFRPREFWPRRKLSHSDAQAHSAAALEALVAGGLLVAEVSAKDRQSQIDQATTTALAQFDVQLREFAYQRQREALRELRPDLIELAIDRMLAAAHPSRPLSPAERTHLTAAVAEQIPPQLMGPLSIGESAGMAERVRRELDRMDVAATMEADDSFVRQLHAEFAECFRGRWAAHVAELDGQLAERGAKLYTRLALEELLAGGKVADGKIADALRNIRRLRKAPDQPGPAVAAHHGVAAAPLPDVEPIPKLAEIQAELSRNFARRLVLWQKDRSELTAAGGELDLALQMPGWANVWTMPIQNRVDMLATGVNTDVGICVLGPDLDTVVETSERIAAVVKRLSGASGVVADPIRGKQYLDIRLDHAAAAQFRVAASEADSAIAAALGGQVAVQLPAVAGSLPVRLRFPREWREDREMLRRLPIIAGSNGNGAGNFVTLGQIATIDLVEGPATIKGEQGELRNYVRLNVRGQGAAAFVAEAKRIVADEVPLPSGVRLEWTGQFAQHERTLARLTIIVPVTIALILLLLHWTYRDLGDALLMLLAVPGAIAGGVLLQWLLGETLSITVVVGYLACLGMATATGVIMLVYLREAVAQAGDFDSLSLGELRQAVLTGAVQRLRPKLLTELTTIIGLAPMLWATGVGAEVIRPMAVPVLGGILVADEVIDLFLPVMFYWVRRRRLLARRSQEQVEHAPGLPAAA
jgi:Cu(I)/Ag(I) efflux system membrane protein CusA/SilA